VAEFGFESGNCYFTNLLANFLQHVSVKAVGFVVNPL